MNKYGAFANKFVILFASKIYLGQYWFRIINN